MNLNKLNLIEIELFIEMLYGVLFSVQPDYETNKSPRRMQVSAPVTGAAGSMIVPQYGFSKITAVFVWGKNTILKFVGNTKYKSMKLTLQLLLSLLLQRNSNSNIKLTCQDRSNRIAADTETNEAFPDRKTNPADFDKLEGCNPKWPRICSPK